MQPAIRWDPSSERFDKTLKKKRVIVIKPRDKWAGIIILDYPVYMRALRAPCFREDNWWWGNKEVLL